MIRAAKVCPTAGCPHIQPCPDHPRGAWATSRRRERSTLSGSRQQQRARYVIDRDDTICHVCGHLGANEADHIIPLAEGGADTVENMAAIHAHPCHRDKTQQEAARAAHR